MPPSKNTQSKAKTVLLIDGDVFVYQIGLAVEKVTDWGNDLWTLHSDLQEAKDTFNSRVQALIDNLKADSVRFALSCRTEDGYRRAICPTYKANRAGHRKPICHIPLREWMLETFDTLLRDKLEADDILGILATQPTTERRIIVSIDKDYQGVPCLFYRTNDSAPVLQTVSKESALRFHAIQTLTGDRVDGYQGIPGVGPKTAEKLLDGAGPSDFWPIIVKAYKEAGLSENVALTNARLARILQHGDYDIETENIVLWNPPSPARTTKPSKPSAKSPKTSGATKPSKRAT